MKKGKARHDLIHRSASYSGGDVTEEPMSYIGRAKCGCIRYAAVDTPDMARQIANDIVKIIRDGGTVERVTSEYVRQNMRRCTHK